MNQQLWNFSLHGKEKKIKIMTAGHLEFDLVFKKERW